MLVPGESRWTAKQIWKEFDGFFTNIKAERSAVPKGLHDLLQNIDLRSEQLYDQHSGIRRVDSDDTSKTPKVVPSLPRTDIEFESREKLLEQVIQPVAQRSQNRNGSPTQSRHPSISFHPALDTRTNGQKFPREVGKQNVTAQQLPKALQKHAIDTSSTPDQPNLSLPPSNQSHDRDLITVWKVEQELQKNGLEWRPSIRSFRSLVQKQETTVRGKSNLELLDQRLETEFKDRDIVSPSLFQLIFPFIDIVRSILSTMDQRCQVIGPRRVTSSRSSSGGLLDTTTTAWNCTLRIPTPQPMQE